MKPRSGIMGLVLIVAISHIFVPVFAEVEAPTTQIRATMDRVLTILQERSVVTKEERRKRLRQVIYPAFDFKEMAKRSLGALWRQRTPKEQREFMEIFTDLLKDVYLEQIEAYSGERVIYVGEAQDKNYAEVMTKIISQKGQEFSINYKLHLVKSHWKAYDVVIENISVVNNYRSQFNRIVARFSYEELLRRMKEKRIGVKEKP